MHFCVFDVLAENAKTIIRIFFKSLCIVLNYTLNAV